MAVIDRNVLRVATYELLHCDDIPPKVAINEAIELGKRYSTQNSGAFINGILDKIMNRKPSAAADVAAPAPPAGEGAGGVAAEGAGETAGEAQPVGEEPSTAASTEISNEG